MAKNGHTVTLYEKDNGIGGLARCMELDGKLVEKAQAVEAVFGLMAEGKTVKEAVSALKLGVTAGAVRKWMSEREDWMGRYQQMKKLLAAALAEEAITVARETTNHSSAADRLLIETLKWAAAKANPAEYGEKQTVEHQGAQTLQVRIVEDDAPLRNPKAAEQVGNAVATAIATPVMLTIPAPRDYALNPSEDGDN